MKHYNRTSILAAVIACGLIVGCSDSDDDDNNASNNNDNESPEVSFDFSTAAPEDYSRVDRSGMPAISTALIASKDSYNASNPTDDIDGTFVPEILATLGTLHGALDDQLTGLGLTPCTVVGDGTGTCAEFAVPLIIPDTVKIDTTADAGFPNGRLLSDPVIGVTLAVALIELTGDPAPHAPTALVGVLNPSANDREFEAEFPFLASPNP